MDTEQRVIALDGAVNFRDLGGYENFEGKTLKSRRIFRAGNLSMLTVEDRMKLADLRITQDIDLRSPSEQTAYPDSHWDDVTLVVDPVYPVDGVDGFSAPRTIYKMMHKIPKVNNPMGQIYQNIILTPHSQRAFAKVFEVLLAQPDNEAIVFHCAAGKDRTGITAALILMALEMPEKTIIQDYLLTNDLYDFAVAKKNPTNDKIQNMVDEMNLHTGEAENILGIIKTINAGCGGFKNFWTDVLKFSTNDLKAFQNKYLV